MTDIVDLSARQMRRRIGRKEISPVELFDACVERIEAVDPAVNAVVARDFERGRRAAQEAEQAVMRGDGLGPLHGLPVGVKDLTETEGLATTFGSLVFKTNVPAADDPMVARIRAAGGIVIGKTNTPEFGAGANTVNRVYGATVNPFAPTMTCAGSSGGSAVALACAMMPLATGSDLGGSLRTPASFTGVVGHRPSPGAVASETRRRGWAPLSVEGPMARDAEDAALLMAAMVGATPRDPLSLNLSPANFMDLPEIDLSSLRVAFSADLGGVPVSREVREMFTSRAEAMAGLFATADWRDPPLGDTDDTFETLRAIGFAGDLTEYVARHRDLAGPNVIANVEFARRLSIADVAKAEAGHTGLIRAFEDWFEGLDFLICPAASEVPFPVEQLFVSEIDGEKLGTYISWCAVAYAITLTGRPSTVIPCGLGPTGLPFGIQVVGPFRGDARTLAAAGAIARALDAAPDLRRPIPDIPGLRSARTSAGVVPPVLEAHAGVLTADSNEAR